MSPRGHKHADFFSVAVCGSDLDQKSSSLELSVLQTALMSTYINGSDHFMETQASRYG